MEVSYWNGNARFQSLYERLNDLIPDSGKVTRPKSPKLERLRKMANAYYDVYNNGGYNRMKAINSYFGITRAELPYGGRVNWDRIATKTEPVIEKAILEAAKEQKMINLVPAE